jgi:hypothetical protein
MGLAHHAIHATHVGLLLLLLLLQAQECTATC